MLGFDVTSHHLANEQDWDDGSVTLAQLNRQEASDRARLRMLSISLNIFLKLSQIHQYDMSHMFTYYI